MRLDVYIHSGNNDAKLDQVLRLVQQLIKEEAKMAGELDTLKTQVAANNDLIGSAIQLIQGIKAALDAAIASGDPAALADLSAQLAAKDQELAAAIAANTPNTP